LDRRIADKASDTALAEPVDWYDRAVGADLNAKGVPVVLIARFEGNVEDLREAYDRAHALIMSRGGATRFGELRHHCAIGENALYIIGVWESEDQARRRWTSPEFDKTLTSAGFPSPRDADLTILELHATEPAL
jgi:hypothetical protein